AYAAVVQCEVWLVVAAGMIFLGFGGSDWTADYAKRYLTYCLSASAKLYLLYLIIGFGQQSIHNWINDLDRSSLAVMMGPVALLVVWAVLVIQLPNILQSLLNGVALHGGAPMLMGMGASMAKSAVMAAASAATVGAAGGAMAVSEAAKLATTQLGTGAAAVMGGAASSSPSGGQVLGQTLSNLGSGVMGMAGGHIMQSTMGGRIAQNLHARRMASEMDLGSGSGSYSGVVSPAPESSQPYVSPAHQRE
ncbi:MAG: type IV secretion system protein, partial [Candidatus Tectomicrobia bacterium]|nr:type IV secretion system protein [Candidatus Tectomicrobia bacterium]